MVWSFVLVTLSSPATCLSAIKSVTRVAIVCLSANTHSWSGLGSICPKCWKHPKLLIRYPHNLYTGILHWPIWVYAGVFLCIGRLVSLTPHGTTGHHHFVIPAKEFNLENLCHHNPLITRMALRDVSFIPLLVL